MVRLTEPNFIRQYTKLQRLDKLLSLKIEYPKNLR